jgi:hypothetical protein
LLMLLRGQLLLLLLRQVLSVQRLLFRLMQ